MIRAAATLLMSPLRREAIRSSRRIFRETLRDVNELPGLGQIERREIRAKVRESISRPRARSAYLSRLWMPLNYLVMTIVLITLLTVTSLGTNGENTELLTPGIAIGAVATGVVILSLASLNGWYRKNRILNGFLYCSCLLYLFSLLSHSALRQSWTAVSAYASMFPVSLFLYVYIYSAILTVIARRTEIRTGSIYKRAARSMLQTAALAARSRDSWDSARVSRNLIASIEDLARSCQDSLALRGRIGILHRDVFSQTAAEALRVSQLVREHKKLIACASTPDDFERVAISLSNGLLAALNNDREKLLENSPEAVRKERLKIALKHILPAVVFIAAAISFPLLPPISGQEKIGESLRLTFIVAAVLTLIAPRSESSTRILETLGRAIPFKG